LVIGIFQDQEKTAKENLVSAKQLRWCFRIISGLWSFYHFLISFKR